jgi:hypothetical protein
MSIQYESNPSSGFHSPADGLDRRARFIHSGRRESTTDYDDDAVERDCVRR